MPDMSGKLELMHLVERLKLQKRTGWVREGCRDPESIADHMYRMAVMALLSEEDEELDVAKCVQMAVVHDLAEAEVGDITPFDGISKEEKQARETVRTSFIKHIRLQQIADISVLQGCNASNHEYTPSAVWTSSKAHR